MQCQGSCTSTCTYCLNNGTYQYHFCQNDPGRRSFSNLAPNVPTSKPLTNFSSLPRFSEIKRQHCCSNQAQNILAVWRPCRKTTNQITRQISTQQSQCFSNPPQFTAATALFAFWTSFSANSKFRTQIQHARIASRRLQNAIFLSINVTVKCHWQKCDRCQLSGCRFVFGY